MVARYTARTGAFAGPVSSSSPPPDRLPFPATLLSGGASPPERVCRYVPPHLRDAFPRGVDTAKRVVSY
jgi:hypothetical protein